MDPSHDTSRYTVGWIAPLPLELTAAVRMLEDPTTMEVPDDDVLYHVGRIGSHFSQSLRKKIPKEEDTQHLRYD